MFIDKAKIIIKAGNGGNGCASFLSTKLSNLGGPDGGDGGKGGDVVFVATNDMTTLLDFKYKTKFAAGDGAKGMQKNCFGKSGQDVIIKVPCGTIVKDGQGDIICDLVKAGDGKVVLRGGKGGRGNSAFATATRQAPRFCELGEKTEPHTVFLELKTIADIGLVGFPNAGKSTLLSVISAARPKIADYPFTTLSPNLGVVAYHDKSFVAADIPGLIEGAAEGMGLGHEFLRHIERVRLILHVIDAAGADGRDPYSDYAAINKELKKYSERLSKLPQIIVLNKCDLFAEGECNTDTLNDLIKKLPKKALVYKISAATKAGVKELIDATWKKLSSLPSPETLADEEYAVLDKPKENTFEIIKESDGLYNVTGGMIERLARGVVLNDEASFAYFQTALKKRGIIDALLKEGMRDGDTVRILDIEFEYSE